MNCEVKKQNEERFCVGVGERERGIRERGTDRERVTVELFQCNQHIVYRQNNNIRRVDFKRIGSVLPVRSRCCFGHTQYIIQWTSCGLPWIDVCPRACVDDIISIDNPKCLCEVSK